MTGNLFEWTPHELQSGKQFEAGDKVSGPAVMSNLFQEGLTRGPAITGSITEIGWKYLRTDKGDIWRDEARYQQKTQVVQGKLF